MYTPDTWVIVKITNPENGKFHHRVFAGWYGGYTGGDSWQLNSGITKVERTNVDGHDAFLFHGVSGSIYQCFVGAYKMSGYQASVLASYQKHNQMDALTQEEFLANPEGVASA